jgi:hypothetical protein
MAYLGDPYHRCTVQAMLPKKNELSSWGTDRSLDIFVLYICRRTVQFILLNALAACSMFDQIIELFFFSFNFAIPSIRPMALRFTQPVTKTSTRKSFWGVKRGRRVCLTGSTPYVSRLSRKCEIIDISTPWAPTAYYLLYISQEANNRGPNRQADQETRWLWQQNPGLVISLFSEHGPHIFSGQRGWLWRFEPAEAWVNVTSVKGWVWKCNSRGPSWRDAYALFHYAQKVWAKWLLTSYLWQLQQFAYIR